MICSLARPEYPFKICEQQRSINLSYAGAESQQLDHQQYRASWPVQNLWFKMFQFFRSELILISN